MTRWNLLLITGLLLAGCSSSTDSEPEETSEITVNFVGPASMPKDNLQSITVGFSHPDGLLGTYKHTIAGQQVISKIFQGEMQWDTTYTLQLPPGAQNLDEDTRSFASYDLRSQSDVPVTAQETKTVLLTESPFFEGHIPVSDILTGEPLDGYVTFQGDLTTVEIKNGEAQISRGMKIRKNTLDQGKLALFEAPGYVPQRQHVKRTGNGLEEISTIPRKQGAFDFETYLTFLREDGDGNKIIHQYEKGSTIDVYVVDRGVFREVDGVFQRTDTDNDLLYPSEEFVNDYVVLHNYLAPLLNEVAAIDMNLHIQSESSFDFPLGFPNGSMTVGSEEDAMYDLTHLSSVYGGIITWSRMLQQVYADTGPDNRNWFTGVCHDTFQSFIYSPENPRAMCGEDDVTALAEPVMKVKLQLRRVGRVLQESGLGR